MAFVVKNIRRIMLFLFTLLVLYSYEVKSSEEVNVIKYGFGLPLQHDIKHNIYPLRSGYLKYHTISDRENKNQQLGTGVKVHLSVRKEKHQVIADVSIYNKGGQDIFVYAMQIPSGLEITSEKKSYSKLCGEIFL